jgi:hypothetical protein
MVKNGFNRVRTMRVRPEGEADRNAKARPDDKADASPSEGIRQIGKQKAITVKFSGGNQHAPWSGEYSFRKDMKCRYTRPDGEHTMTKDKAGCRKRIK